MSDSVGQYSRFAGTGAGEDEERSIYVSNRLLLSLIELGERVAGGAVVRACEVLRREVCIHVFGIPIEIGVTAIRV